jgi:hypothetical protein
MYFQLPAACGPREGIGKGVTAWVTVLRPASSGRLEPGRPRAAYHTIPGAASSSSFIHHAQGWCTCFSRQHSTFSFGAILSMVMGESSLTWSTAPREVLSRLLITSQGPLHERLLQCTLAVPYPRTYERHGLLAFQKSSSHFDRLPLRHRCTYECQPWTSFGRPAPCSSRRTRAIDHAFRC